MDILIDALMDLGWSMREPLNIMLNKTYIIANPISSTETRWCIRNEVNSHYFTSEIGPDEYDYIVDELSMFF